jgi:hypothetical protein
MECEYCDKQFIDNMMGMSEKTLHMIIMHGNKVNNEDEDE